MKHLILFLIMIIISSCGDDKLNKVETLGGFRILAIKASASEKTQANGLTVTATPYVSDVNGAGRSITGTVDGCVDPGVAYGADATCEGNSTKVSAAYTINGARGGTKLNSGWADPTAALSIPDAIFTGRTTREKFNGVPFLIVFTFVVDGSTYKSFRRIHITNRTSLNTDPTLSSLKLNGGAIAKPSNGDSLSASYSGAETYDYMRVDGVTETRTEKLVMAWYVSEGELDISKATAAESVKYKSTPPSGNLLVIGVLRDERGGVAVQDDLL